MHPGIGDLEMNKKISRQRLRRDLLAITHAKDAEARRTQREEGKKNER